MRIPNNAKTYVLKVNDSEGSLLRLLEAIQKLGSDGSSRSIVIERDETRYGFDGDGSDKIYDIQVQEGSELIASNKYVNFVKQARKKK